jgi:hypothetical protein
VFINDRPARGRLVEVDVGGAVAVRGGNREPEPDGAIVVDAGVLLERNCGRLGEALESPGKGANLKIFVCDDELDGKGKYASCDDIV